MDCFDPSAVYKNSIFKTPNHLVAKQLGVQVAHVFSVADLLQQNPYTLGELKLKLPKWRERAEELGLERVALQQEQSNGTLKPNEGIITQAFVAH